jgi:hypothetical protein
MNHEKKPCRDSKSPMLTGNRAQRQRTPDKREERHFTLGKIGNECALIAKERNRL